MEQSYADVLNAIHQLKKDEKFKLYLKYLREMFEASRLELEKADQNFRHQQGRVSCLREQLQVIDTALEVQELIGEALKGVPTE